MRCLRAHTRLAPRSPNLRRSSCSSSFDAPSQVHTQVQASHSDPDRPLASTDDPPRDEARDGPGEDNDAAEDGRADEPAALMRDDRAGDRGAGEREQGGDEEDHLGVRTPSDERGSLRG